MAVLPALAVGLILLGKALIEDPAAESPEYGGGGVEVTRCRVRAGLGA